MKPQDILFVAILAIILIKRFDPKWVALLGVSCILLSMPLFSLWIFFTAQRLMWYAAAFFLVSVTLTLLRLRKNTV